MINKIFREKYLEISAGSVMMMLIVSELVTGFLALRQITRHQANKFHLQQFIVNNNKVEGFVNLGYQEDEYKKLQ